MLRKPERKNELGGVPLHGADALPLLRRVMPRIYRGGARRTVITARLAFEMVIKKDAERQALDGELATLEPGRHFSRIARSNARTGAASAPCTANGCASNS